LASGIPNLELEDFIIDHNLGLHVIGADGGSVLLGETGFDELLQEGGLTNTRVTNGNNFIESFTMRHGEG